MPGRYAASAKTDLVGPFGLFHRGARSLVKTVRWIAKPGRRPRAEMLYLEITHRCNFACITCYTHAGREKPDVLTFAEQKSVVRQARRMGARLVSLAGSGEPLLCPHILALIDFIKDQSMGVVLFTNGSRIDPKTAHFLIDRNVVTYFKLGSLDPAVYDEMAGRTNAHAWVQFHYRRAGQAHRVNIPQGLKCLLEAQEAARKTALVKIEALITALNGASLPRVAAFARDLNLGVFFETPVYHGRALANRDRIAPSAEQYRALHEALVPFLGADCLQRCRDSVCPVQANPVVWTNGDVALCACRAAGVGNVRQTRLRELWAKAMDVREGVMDRLPLPQTRYFRTCPARRSYEALYGLPCDY